MAVDATRAPVPQLAGAVRLLVERAERVRAAHCAGVDGWCAGCVSDGHLVLHPCLYARWACQVRQHYRQQPPRHEGVMMLRPPDETNQRPDLYGTMLDLAPGQWWSQDGRLRVQVLHVGTTAVDRPLPDGWTWVMGVRYDHGGDDYCYVPVREDALPASNHPRP